MSAPYEESKILAELAAITAILDQYISYMNEKEMGDRCEALHGVMTLLELLSSNIEEGSNE